MIIAIFHNAIKKEAIDIARNICDFLKSRSVTVVAEDEEAYEIGALKLSEIGEGEGGDSLVNFCISLGGDGTLLRFIHRYPKIVAPTLAINLGSLGFMTDIPIDDIFTSLHHFLEGNYTIDSRLVIEGWSNHHANFAINEVVIHRASNPCIIDLTIHVDGRYLNTFSADGVIVSTPTGSTAYSLASGGPILTPELNAIVLTPICPHTISNRPIVLLPKNELQIEYSSFYSNVEVSFDGMLGFTMAAHEILSVRRSERVFRLVNMPGHDYYTTLRTKLGWSGNLRAKSHGSR